MRIAVFSVKPYDRDAMTRANAPFGHELTFFETRLHRATSPLAAGFDGVCVFVNDEIDAAVIERLAQGGTRIIATRSAGYNHIDLAAAARHNIAVARVPAYSPNAISEFTVGLILTLGRSIHRAYQRVRENNFELAGLEGFEIRDKTVGIIGTGKIGAATIKNLSGFGCKILAYDKYRNPDIEGLATYVDSLRALMEQSDILSLHIPLTPDTYHLIDASTMFYLKDGVMIVNTSRGALLDARAMIDGLKSGKIGYLAIDVYEEEGDLFYQDLSNKIVADDTFARLQTFPNVLITGHQAFLTDHALRNIADTTLDNFTSFYRTGKATHAVTLEETRG